MKKIVRDAIVEELCYLMKELRLDSQAHQRDFYMRRINIILHMLNVHSWDDEIKEN